MSNQIPTKKVMDKFKPFNSKKLADNQRPSLKKMAKREKKKPSFGQF